MFTKKTAGDVDVARGFSCGSTSMPITDGAVTDDTRVCGASDGPVRRQRGSGHPVFASRQAEGRA
jgi:hypothetical protein